MYYRKLIYYKLLRDCTSIDLESKKFKRCGFPWQLRDNPFQLTPLLNRHTARTLLEFPALWFVNKDRITVTEAKLVSFCNVANSVNLSLKQRWTMKPKLSDSAQLLISYVVPQQIRGLRRADLQNAKEGEDTKPIQSQSSRCYVLHKPFSRALGAPKLLAISEVKVLTPGLTKQRDLPTAELQAARSSRLWRGGDSSLLHSSQSRDSDGRNAVRSVGTAGSAWLALVAAKQNQTHTH